MEDLTYYCKESDYGTKTAQRAIREYLTNLQACEMSGSVHSITRSAIKSYFGTNDVGWIFPRPEKNAQNRFRMTIS